WIVTAERVAQRGDQLAGPAHGCTLAGFCASRARRPAVDQQPFADGFFAHSAVCSFAFCAFAATAFAAASLVSRSAFCLRSGSSVADPAAGLPFGLLLPLPDPTPASGAAADPAAIFASTSASSLVSLLTLSCASFATASASFAAASAFASFLSRAM